MFLVQFDLVEGLIIEGSWCHMRRRRCRWLGGSHLCVGFSLSNSSSFPSSLGVWAFARWSSPWIEWNILLLHVSTAPFSICIVRSKYTHLMNRFDFLSSGNTSVGPSMRNLSELGTHHRAFHSGGSELRDIVDVCRCGTSEGSGGRVT